MVLGLGINCERVDLLGPQKDGGDAVAAANGYVNGLAVKVGAPLVFENFGAVFFHASPRMMPIAQSA